MARQMNECAEDLVKSLSKEVGTGNPFDIWPYVPELIFSRKAVMGGIVLERKRKPHRLEWILSFFSCVFTMNSGRDQRKVSLALSRFLQGY